ncbi:MAG: hypothetical protein QOD07_2625 [Frankiaceae bacterium]|nr:hypothetical protein [Frankiaceae bacterium]
MRQLHVLGVSDDGDTLLLGTSAKGKVTHRLSLDNRLRQAVRGQLAAPGADRAESVLSPKEIQARLRAGATPDEVAKVARVPVARVLPYFAPVEAERERIVEEARSAVLHRSRGPQPTQPLGGVVDARLREVAGLKDDSVAWTARRRADGSWVVRLTYTARGGQRRAEWLWRPAGREVTALDPSATRLAAEAAPAPKRKPVRRPAAKKAAAPARKAAAKKAAAKKAGAATKRVAAAAKKAAPATRKAAPAAKKPAAKKPVAKRPVAKQAVPAARKPAAKKAAPRRTAAPAVTAPTPLRRRPAKAATRPRVLEVVPDPVPVVTPVEPTVVAVAAAVEPKPARRAGARVPIPSWSDVLLGVTGRDPDPDPGDDATPRTSSGGRRRRT